MKRTHSYRLGFAVAAWLASSTAHALGDDTLQVSAGYELRYDDNLFRLPQEVDPRILDAAGGKSDTMGMASVGLHLNKSYSLQRVEANVGLVDYRYQTHDNLSFTATNYDAAWHWSMTPAFRGVFSSSRKEAQGSYGDIQSTNVTNRRTNVLTRVEGAYDLDGGAWSVLGGLNRSSQTNTQQTIGEDDSRTTSVFAGLRRTFLSGSSLSSTLKNTQGRYLNRTLSSTALLDDEFSQWDYGLRLGWNVTAQSAIDLSISYINREHANFGQRDYDGWVGSAGLRWSLSPKTALQFGVGQDLNAYQTANSNFTRTQRLSFAPSWRLTEKAVLEFRHELARVSFLGSPSLGVIGGASQRKDTTNNSSLSFQWQSTRNLTLNAGLQYGRRTSNTASVDYSSNQANLGAQLRF